jgi:hypothetical protein
MTTMSPLRRRMIEDIALDSAILHLCSGKV